MVDFFIGTLTQVLSNFPLISSSKCPDRLKFLFSKKDFQEDCKKPKCFTYDEHKKTLACCVEVLATHQDTIFKLIALKSILDLTCDCPLSEQEAALVIHHVERLPAGCKEIFNPILILKDISVNEMKIMENYSELQKKLFFYFSNPTKEDKIKLVDALHEYLLKNSKFYRLNLLNHERVAEHEYEILQILDHIKSNFKAGHKSLHVAYKVHEFYKNLLKQGVYPARVLSSVQGIIRV